MRQLSPEFLGLCSPATHDLVSRFSSGLDHFRAFASGVALPWELDPGDAPRVHNHHVDLLVATYAGRYLSYADILLGGLSELNYAAYAHAGRAMVEMVATLRYYVEEQYAPILNRPPVDLSRLLDIHERHLRGSRFDWHRFVYGDYEAMAKKILDDIANKRQKREPLTTNPQLEQINVVTCIEKWALSAPVVMLLYKMFCDLVHPNVGSNLLTASEKTGRSYVGVTDGTPIGHLIFEQSFMWLLSVGHKAFSKYLTLLMGMKYQPDELPGSSGE